jgi:hypothetical protein
MTGRVVPLTSPEAGDPRMGGTVDERVAAVAALTEHAWTLANRPFPVYTRATMPIVVTTLASQSDSDDRA